MDTWFHVQLDQKILDVIYWKWLAGHARPLFDWEKVFSARFITYVLFFNSRLVSTLGAVHKRRRQLGEGEMEGSKMGQKFIKIADR